MGILGLTIYFCLTEQASEALDSNVRDAVTARAKKLGIEKSQATADYIKRRNEEALAAANAAEKNRSNDMFGGIDMSKIRTEAAPRSTEDDEDMLPFMASDLIDEEMDDEMKREADPVSFLPIWEQALVEIKETTWPSPLAALKRVVVVTIVIIVTSYGFDFLTNTYLDFFTNTLHILPTQEMIDNAKPPPGAEEFYDNLADFAEESQRAMETSGVRSVF